MSATFFDLLKYAATGQASQSMTDFDKMWALSMIGGLSSITGIPPISFTGNGKPLVSWSMLGNGSQTGTPTPDTPIMPDFVGTLSGSDWTIPITCAGQTQTVYLGQTQTARRVKKFVFDGTENWRITQGKFYLDSINPDYMRASGSITYFCSHFPAYPQTNSAGNVPENMIALGAVSINQRVYCTYTGVSTAADFKTYLAAQYAAGTPVTVWYVLAEPETGIVNEPLAKIEDYADELSSTIPIPTVKGQNTLTVDTDLQPSSMTITGNIKEV